MLGKVDRRAGTTVLQGATVRMPCIEPRCPKFMPQLVVCHASELARGFVRGFDRLLDGDPYFNNPSMELCQICCAYFGPLLVHDGDAACELCWVVSWVNCQLPNCRQIRQLECSAFNPQHVLPNAYGLQAAWGARELDCQLRRRETLQRNPLYPPVCQVDGPQPGCVGIGYLGAETIMCFICEHQ